MGSFLSSAAGAAGEVDHGARAHRSPTIKECTRLMTNQELARLDGYDPVSFQELMARGNAGRPTLLQDEADSAAVCKLVRCALKHYNSKNPGVDFEYPAELTTEMKATGISFRERFWYHVGFLARRRNAGADDELQHFFAELRFNEWTRRPNVQTCTILEKPLCRFRSRCAFCTDGSKVLHPSDTEFACGKEGHEKEFFNKKDMQVWPIDPMRHASQM
ncbi:hypothetical protein VPH35_074128 [Triticum aestivum]|nr:uncharacterized protein LOC123093036 [Triticum aestivum]XP_044370847.1 uncharacterized protein LOC123093036 [Triticum aestivum]